MKIEQYVISKHISFFEDKFKKRWNLNEYRDINKPLFFFGFNGLNHIFENHNGYKIVLPSTPTDLPNFRSLKNLNKTILILETDPPNGYFIPNEVVSIKMILPIKDYSIFTPNKMGDKVYYYSGFSNGWSPNPKSFINEIQQKINFEIITTNHINKPDMYDIEYLKSEYYDKCFVNLNFTNGHGMTTVRELALMGRKTITNSNYYDYDCIIRCVNKDDIINFINTEAKKIDTIQKSINVHTYNYDFLDVELLKNLSYDRSR